MRRKGGWFQRLVFVGIIFFCDRDGSTQAKAVFVEREEDDEKERADSSRGKQRQRADSSG